MPIDRSRSLRLFVPTEIEVLRAIDKASRVRYGALAEFGFVSQADPIAADRFSVGLTVVAEISKRPAGFVLLQPLDGLLYLARRGVGEFASSPRLR